MSVFVCARVCVSVCVYTECSPLTKKHVLYIYTQYIFYMLYSAHYIIYTALSTLYLRALHPVCMFATKRLYNNHFNNKDMDVPLGIGLFPKRTSGFFHSRH